jgi:cytochrome d ubiquinol oxidase subunit I
LGDGVQPFPVVRVFHVYSGAWQAGAWLALSVSAWHLLQKKHLEFARATFKIALVVSLVSSLLQLVSGHLSARVVARYQPEKLAAMEGLYTASAPADLHLFGWVDERSRRVEAGLAVPGLLSYMVKGDVSAPVPGMDSFPPADLPPVNFTFQTYHAMVAIGMALIALSLWGVFLWWRGTLWETRPTLWLFVLAVLGPQAANQMGWFAAEVGRQPWIVYRLLRTSEGLSKIVSAQLITGSLLMFTFIYMLLFAVFIFLLDKKIRTGPEEIDGTAHHVLEREPRA